METVFNEEIEELRNAYLTEHWTDAGKHPSDAKAVDIYLELLRYLLMVYLAERSALEEISQRYPGREDELREYLGREAADLIDLINDEKHVGKLNYEISYFRFYRNPHKLLNHMLIIIRQVGEALVRLYAIIDHDGTLKEKAEAIADSKFTGEAADKLLAYFRQQTEKPASDLSNGLDILRDFIWNFGVKISDGEHTVQCEVRDV